MAVAETLFLAVSAPGAVPQGAQVLYRDQDVAVLKVREPLQGVKVLEPYRGNYFWARVLREGGLQDIQRAGVVLYQVGNRVLFRLVDSLSLSTRRLMIFRLRDNGGEEEPRPEGSSTGYDPVIQEMVNSVDSSRYLGFVRTLQDFVTRNSFTQGCEDAVQWAYDYFANLPGIDTVYLDTFRSIYAPNVVAVKRGLESDSAVVICAHIDATAGFPWYPEGEAPGADDNGSGSAVVLEAATVLSAYQFRREIRFILFSGEEQGLVGSYDYASRHAGDPILGVLNFDMVGYSDDENEDLDIISDYNSVWLLDSAIACLRAYVGAHPVDRRVDPSFGASDHSSFWEFDKPAILFIEDEDVPNPFYHTAGDTVGGGFEDLALAATFAKLGVATLAALAEPISSGGREERPEPSVRAFWGKGRLVLASRGAFEAEVFSAAGQRVASVSGSGQITLRLKPGVYIVKFKGNFRIKGVVF